MQLRKRKKTIIRPKQNMSAGNIKALIECDNYKKDNDVYGNFVA